MAQTANQFGFLIEYVLALLEENNINLSEEQKKVYVPQVLAQLEMRLGLKLFPKLNDKQKDEFVSLMNDESTTPQEWKDFWYGSVPTFEDDLKETLVEFSEKTKQMLANNL